MLQASSKQKHSTKKANRTVKVITAALLLFVFGLSTMPKPTVQAATQAELRAQARDLQAQIDANNAKVRDLQQQAQSLQSKLQELNIEIDNINQQINLTNVKIAELQDELQKAQAELERQKGLLKASMRALYKKGGASTVELLIASDSFSQFIDDQEYLDRLKGAIQDSANRVIELKQQIQKQQDDQKNLLAEQQSQRDVLAAKQNEQQVLLDQTRGQAALYSQAAESLRQQQAAINAQLLRAGEIDYAASTSYPWANYEPWSFDSCSVDPWGMCVRQCVSYTAWAVAHSGRNMPYWGGHGNANQWPSNARADGIPVDGNPRVGDVAISMGGFYGHAMYVEAVLPGGMIHVSQFNYELQGRYSEMNVSASGLYFIHFP